MILLHVKCDGCQRLAGPSVPNNKNAPMLFRHRLRKDGWSHPHGTGKDYCGDCTKKKQGKS